VCVAAVITFVWAQDTASTGVIYGIVLSAGQEVVGGAVVEVVAGPSGIGTKTRSRGAESVNYDGGFFMRGLWPGTYKIEVSHEKYFPQVYEGLKVEAGRGMYLVAELKPIADVAGSISGTVAITGGSPEGLVLSCIRVEDKKIQHTVTLDKRGKFLLGGLIPGDYVLTVIKGRGEIYRSDPLKVSAKKKVVHTIRLPAQVLYGKPGWISGKVTGTDNKPVGSAKITMTKKPEGQRKVTATSGADGKFEIKDLIPGSYELKATKSGLSEGTKKTTVRSGRGSRVSFRLKAKK